MEELPPPAEVGFPQGRLGGILERGISGWKFRKQNSFFHTKLRSNIKFHNQQNNIKKTLPTLRFLEQ